MKHKVKVLLSKMTSLLIPIAILLVWQLTIQFYEISEFILPSPSAVFVSLSNLIQTPETWSLHFRVTLTETMLGFMLALIFGLFFGIMFGKYRWLEHALSKRSFRGVIDTEVEV